MKQENRDFVDFFNQIFGQIDFMPGMKQQDYSIKHGDNESALLLAVPGYSKDDITITVEDNNTITITGESKSGLTSVLKRTFTIPANKIDMDAIVAKVENGVLAIIFTHAKKSKKTIKVQ